MRKSDLLRQGILYAGLTRQEFLEILPTIRAKNKQTLRISSALGLLLLSALFIVSFFSSSLAGSRFLYLSFLLVMAVLLACTYLRTANDRLILPLCYLFLAAAFAFSILLGTVLQKTIPATTFCVLLFALPLLLIDQPYRITLLQIAAAVIFILVSAQVKPAAMASMDRINAISFLSLAAIVNFYFLKTKIRDVLQRSYIEKERDTDDLTRLLTKAAAQREINRYIKESGEPAALLVIDIDNFKGVNDTMGHAYGDAVLRIMGDCIRNTFRERDLLARFGGDEFVLFLCRISQAAVVKERVEALVQEMRAQLSAPERAYAVTGSIGIALFPEDADSYDQLFQKADAALYAAKAQGKNCYTFYIDAAAVQEYQQEKAQ